MILILFFFKFSIVDKRVSYEQQHQPLMLLHEPVANYSIFFYWKSRPKMFWFGQTWTHCYLIEIQVL